MAVSDHLKIASTELLKAADLVKQEIESLRREAAQTGYIINNRVSDLRRQVQSREHELRLSNGAGHAPQLYSLIQRMQSEIGQKRAEMRNQQVRIETMIRAKQSLVSELESKARTIMP
ncbi:MAG TPA: hypothetical protein VK674_01850 [Candidatus Limnocylindria bacterium]|nr:hypothetical protein [Candidatus Limnocylindria bacterium]